MLDIKIHVLHGKQFHVIRGPLLIPCVIGRDRAHSRQLLPERRLRLRDIRYPASPRSGPPSPGRTPPPGDSGLGLRRRPGLVLLRAHRDPLGPLALRHQPEHRRRHHDALLPGRAGPASSAIQKSKNTRDKLAATAVGGAVGGVVCSPPYMLGRFGILMLGWPLRVLAGRHPDHHRGDTADGRHQRGEGGEVLRQARRPTRRQWRHRTPRRESGVSHGDRRKGRLPRDEGVGQAVHHVEPGRQVGSRPYRADTTAGSV